MTERESPSLFRVRMFCSDCRGTDPDGCFDGSSALLGGKSYPWPVQTFASVEEAKAAGYAETLDCGPWSFEIIDEDDGVVFATDV